MINKIKKQHLIFLSFIFLTLLIGFVSIQYMPSFPNADQRAYNEIVISLMEKGEYPITGGKLVPPGYPIFIAAMYSVFGTYNYPAVFVTQFIFLGIIAFIVFTISRKIISLNIYYSLSASLIVIFWPYFILYSSLLLTEILYTLLLYIYILLILTIKDDASFNKILFTSFILALASLVRPVILLLPLWLIIFKYFLQKVKEKNYFKVDFEITKIRQLTIITLLFILFISPWLFLGFKKTGHFTPVGSQINEVFNKSKQSYEWKVYKTQGYKPGQENTISKYLMTRIKNIYRFWNPGAGGYQAETMKNKYPITELLIQLYSIIYILLIIFAFYSLKYFLKNKSIFLLWLTVFYFWAVHVVLYPYPRYTLPIIPIMIIFALFSISDISNKLIKYK